MTDEEREHEDRSRQSLKKLKANLAAKKEQERAVWEKEQQTKKAATHEAATLIAEHMAAHLGGLIRLLENGNVWDTIMAM
jgi:F0F1-type ATP synthase assembly protein I